MLALMTVPTCIALWQFSLGCLSFSCTSAYKMIKNTGPSPTSGLAIGQGILHVGIADKSDLHCSSAIFNWLSLQHNVITCISE